MLVFIQKSKSGSLSLSVYKAAPFVWQQMILLIYINKSLPSQASLALSLQPIFFLFISGIIVVRLISPRSLCYSRQAFSALSKRRNSFGWFLQKGNKIHGFVFVIYGKGEGTVQKVSLIFLKRFKFGLNR